MRNISEKNLACAVLISLGNSSGSGFLLGVDNLVFLVTAKHVLFDESSLFRSDEIEISCPSSVLNDPTVARIKIQLKEAFSCFSKDYDLAVVSIGYTFQKDGESGMIKSKGIEFLEKAINNPVVINSAEIRLLDDVIVSNDVFVFGYPTSLGISGNSFFDVTRALLRKGIVANVYRKQKTIILDCSVYPGNSGGPVIQVSYDDKGRRLDLIGVVSEYVPFVQTWVNIRDKIKHEEYMNSGYTIAISMDEVLILIEKLQKKFKIL